MSIFRDFNSAAKGHGAPVTVGLVVALIASFLVGWMMPVSSFLHAMAFYTSDALRMPWTFLTYPFASGIGDLIGLVFACLWLWGIGGQVERDLGARRYLSVWLLFSFLCAAGLWVGSVVLNTPAGLVGPWNPIAAVTILWGTRNATAQILLMFVLPITGRWLAWLSAGLVFFGTKPPLLAPFAAAPLIFAYLFAAQKLPFAPYGRGASFGGGRARGENAAGTRRTYSKEYYEEVKRREIQREEKERLRKLFEQSMVDDPEDRPPDR